MPIPPAVTMQTDSLLDGHLPCYDYHCKVEHCHGWHLPPNYVGKVEIWTNTPTPIAVNVQFWENCNLIRFDSCVNIAAANVLFWDTTLVFPQNSQLIVCNSVGPITVAIKPAVAHDTLPAPFVLTDTLCGPFSVQDSYPINHPKQYWEFDGRIFRQVEAMLPNRRYLVR